MEWKATVRNDHGLLKIPNRWLHVHYYEALNILFRFENSMRVFLYAILKNEYFDKWADCSFTIGAGEQGTIKSLAAKRIRQADNFGYLGFDIKAPLMHLTSGELVELITSDAYWPKFRSYFKGNKDIIKNKLLEIGTIRNSLAHFRPMKAEDIEVVKQNSRHTLLGVEDCLDNIFTHTLRVPTNTTEAWYQPISTIGTKDINTTLYFSPNEEWVNVKLTFRTPVLDKKKYSDTFFSYRLGKINSPALLVSHPIISKYVTCLTEAISYPILDDNEDIGVTKDLNFVFLKSVLGSNAEEIAKEFSNIVLKVTEECDLLIQDNLARGSLIEPVSGNTWWRQSAEGKEGQWTHNYDTLSRPYQSSDPDEYWGEVVLTADIVAGCPRYPWMPEDISKVENFFDGD